jgi:hypothetical protein
LPRRQRLRHPQRLRHSSFVYDAPHGTRRSAPVHNYCARPNAAAPRWRTVTLSTAGGVQLPSVPVRPSAFSVRPTPTVLLGHRSSTDQRCPSVRASVQAWSLPCPGRRAVSHANRPGRGASGVPRRTGISVRSSHKGESTVFPSAHRGQSVRRIRRRNAHCGRSHRARSHGSQCAVP